MADRRVTVIGLGNELRGDDAAGVLVARSLGAVAAEDGINVLEHQREPSGLLEIWDGADAVVLVDTMLSGAAAGTVRSFDVSVESLALPPSRHTIRPVDRSSL